MPIRAHRRRLAIVVLVAGVLASSLGTPVRAQSARTSGVLDRWHDELSRIDALILDQKYKAAKKRVNKLLEEMCDQIVRGSKPDRLLAMAALVRAITETALGNMHDARWDRDIAIAIFPGLEGFDLTAYGDAGALLEQPEPGLPTAKLLGDIDPEFITPPKKLRFIAPKYPYGRRVNCLENTIVVQVTIDAEGRLSRPKILKSVSSVLSFAALDILREWRFEPARYKDRPVPVLYNLAVNFELRGC